eukprot:2823087-Prorocentrum_lima.AAC.1
MTSSLVGSEMCIRDRPNLDPQQLLTQAVIAKNCLTNVCGYTPFKRPLACLLYTSDAADDM